MFFRKVFCFFCFASCVCLVFSKDLNSTTLSLKNISSESGLLDKESYFLSFLGFDLPKAFFSRSTESYHISLTESLFVSVLSLLIVFFLWYLKKPKPLEIIEPGFKIINFKEHSSFISLKFEVQTLEFLSEIKTMKKYRLSSNLNRVYLSPHKNTFLLEDKNFKNALLINRRRSHRKILFNNDILDIGEMVLLYCNNIFSDKNFQKENLSNTQKVITGSKPRGPVQKGIPVISVSGIRQEIPLVKNLNSIGTSNFNDIIVESDEVALRHAKIYKVGKSWKIQNLQSHESTLVNGRRIDQRFLQDGDEVAIGDFFFKFKTYKVHIKRSQKIKKEQKIKSLHS